jgi:hypothetical protein
MTKRNQRVHGSVPSANDVEQAADTLRISRGTAEGREVRRQLRIFVPLIIRTFEKRQADRDSRLTVKQELKRDLNRLRALKQTLGDLAEQIVDGSAHALMRDAECYHVFANCAWWGKPDPAPAFEAAVEHSLEEEEAVVYQHISKWRKRMELKELVLKVVAGAEHSRSPGQEGKNALKEPVHWLACMSLLIHNECVRRLEPEVTEPRFVAWMFRLARVNADVRYYVKIAKPVVALAVEQHERNRD